MHIGLIGGIGPAATDYYYRRLIQLYAGSTHSLDITIAHADVATLSANAARGAASEQAGIFLSLIGRLRDAGAQVAAITSMTGHFCVREVEARSPLPIISALPALEATIAGRGLHRVGLLGTRVVMQTGCYGALRSSDLVIPADSFDDVHQAYLGIATNGRSTGEQRRTLFEAGRALCEKGAQAVVLGGTDMFLAFADQDVGFETIDCADVHAEAIYRASTAA
ncbi:aspartate/glutamate racemase family protein [Iodidimonas sp. SYSU 1G8]|uniref:aspartate/glutamate racemase family protein n=1 Tax=Iodidimonas sp. SYSU 1G8 TaxID=3133967 RepID=UPI0031FF3CE4